MGWQGPQTRAMNADANGEWVCLHPFNHQVGGHTGVLLVDETTICKPLVPQEYCTYETMSPSLRKFVPELKGWTNVHICKDKDGNVSLLTLSRGTNGTSVSLPCRDCQRASHSGHLGTNGDKVTITNGNKKSLCAFHSSPRKVDCNYEVADNISETVSNAWSLRCWKRQLWTFEQSGVTKSCKYILLENLASAYEHPSILDLKIGVRAYGDDVTEEKRRAHVAKAKLSTTGTLGVRIGGMQVYQVDKDSYRRCTKHYGKTISDYDTLLSTIREYFHNGISIRRGVLAQFIQSLKGLISVILEEEGCRFFGCSLLALYEGGPSSLAGGATEGGSPPSSHHEHNSGMVNGVTPLTDNIPQTGQSAKLEDSEMSATDDGGSCRTSCDTISTTTTPTDSTSLSPSGEGRLILKVIDFPHVVYQNNGSPRTIYDGPDENFLFGLNNLLEITERIQASL